jgi:uncharacterized protein (DUF924 family)
MSIDFLDQARVNALLDLWFGLPGTTAHNQPRPVWFKADADFDTKLQKFQPEQKAAAAGRLDHWIQATDACLALILLLDQFPRNLYRDTAAAFASDAKALQTARHAVAQRFDQGMPDVRRWFIYLPFEHSEALEDQETSVKLFSALPSNKDNDVTVDYAKKHHDIITRFGRFPHRNKILGRTSTAEEEEFLRQPDSSF